MAKDQFNNGLVIRGDLQVIGGTVSLPSGQIGDTQMSTSSPLDTDKTKHQHLKLVKQESGTTANDETYVVHIAKNSGTIINFVAGCVGANVGDSTVDFDLLKNGVSVLSAAVQVDSGDAARALVSGTISSASYVASDVFEIDIDATVGTGTLGTGAFAEVTFDESNDA